jgi:hypothetical protein
MTQTDSIPSSDTEDSTCPDQDFQNKKQDITYPLNPSPPASSGFPPTLRLTSSTNHWNEAVYRACLVLDLQGLVGSPILLYLLYQLSSIAPAVFS